MKAPERPRVLVVEDDPHLRRSIALILSAEGYDPCEAADGEEGFRSCRGGGWACVLTDTMMPRVDGLEMLRRLRAEEVDLPPVLLVSAAYALPPEPELAALGVREVVPKPFAIDRLLAALRRVVPG
jgi:DNA-binding response OmpR family regulator